MATNVVCRELGYPHAVRTLPGNLVPDGTGRIWLSGVACTGTEQSLTSCSHSGWVNTWCEHSYDIGVECSSTGNVITG